MKLSQEHTFSMIPLNWLIELSHKLVSKSSPWSQSRQKATGRKMYNVLYIQKRKRTHTAIPKEKDTKSCHLITNTYRNTTERSAADSIDTKDKNETKQNTRKAKGRRQTSYHTQPLGPLEIGIGMGKGFRRSSSLALPSGSEQPTGTSLSLHRNF